MLTAVSRDEPGIDAGVMDPRGRVGSKPKERLSRPGLTTSPAWFVRRQPSMRHERYSSGASRSSSDRHLLVPALSATRPSMPTRNQRRPLTGIASVPSDREYD